MKISKISITGISIVFIILLSTYVSAFAVSSAYWDENPLKLTQGETIDFHILLQNIGGTKDINVRADIVTGSEILELIDQSEEYTIPAGGKTKVNLRATVPADVKIEDTFPIEITFTTITETGTGVFGFGSAIGHKFDVVVAPTAEQRAKLEKQEQIIQWAIYLIIGIVILAVIIFFIVKKKKIKGKK